ncbi:MAG: hypothetical protein NZ769_03080 [Anaerolineae bacterium]|nr:hypothetical protein [Anaerolineae bacterium]
MGTWCQVTTFDEAQNFGSAKADPPLKAQGKGDFCRRPLAGIWDIPDTPNGQGGFSQALKFYGSQTC